MLVIPLVLLSISSLVIAVGVWAIYVVVAKGLNEHVKAMQGIYDTLNKKR